VQITYVVFSATTSRTNLDRRSLTLWFMASAIVVLNLIDGVITLAVVYAGAAEEANPLMALSLSWGSVAFMAVKLSLVSLGVLLLWRLRRNSYAAVAMASLTAVYSVVFIYHFRSMSVLVSVI